MLLDNLRAKINAAFQELHDRWDGVLPFGGRYLEALRRFLVANIDASKSLIEAAYESGDVHAAIDFLILMARGNLAVAFPLNLFSGIALEVIARFLHDNADVFKAKIGDPGLRAQE